MVVNYEVDAILSLKVGELELKPLVVSLEFWPHGEGGRRMEFILQALAPDDNTTAPQLWSPYWGMLSAQRLLLGHKRAEYSGAYMAAHFSWDMSSPFYMRLRVVSYKVGAQQGTGVTPVPELDGGK
jgi:hypothetical protein